MCAPGKSKKLAAFLQLIGSAKDHRHQLKVPQKIAKINNIFGAIRTLQMQQNHVLSTIKEHKTGSPDTCLKLISDETLQHIAEVNKHIKGSKPLKNEEKSLFKISPQQFSTEVRLSQEMVMGLEAKLADMPNKADSLKTIKDLLNNVLDRFSNIQLEYRKAPIAEKRIAGSIYPENLCFDGKEHRTPYINTSIELILRINK